MKKIFCLITLFISLISYLYADNIKCDTPLQKLKPKCNIIGKSVDKMKEFGKKNKTLDQSYKNIKEKLKKKIMSPDDKIKSLNIKLPEPKDPVGAYIASKIVDKLVFISGQISINEKGLLIKGKVGQELDINQGYDAAKRCGLAIISQLKKLCDNDLSKVKSCIKLTGYVNSTDDFIDQPKVINGASDIISEVFEDKGMHTRAAVSSNSLPLGVAVEVDAIFELN